MRKLLCIWFLLIVLLFNLSAMPALAIQGGRFISEDAQWWLSDNNELFFGDLYSDAYYKTYINLDNIKKVLEDFGLSEDGTLCMFRQDNENRDYRKNLRKPHNIIRECNRFFCAQLF